MTSIGIRAFSDCSSLTSITIPNSVTSIGNSAFDGCSGLTSVTIPESVTSIGIDAFLGTAWYDNKPDGLIYAGKVAYKYKGTMPDNTNIVIIDETKGIAGSAFNGCSGLTSITMPESVTSIGNNAFKDCSGLTSVNIPNSVTSIGGSAFNGCSGLTSVNIPNSVTSIGSSAFSGCSGLTSITIPEGVTSIGSYAFNGCSRLTKAEFTSVESLCGIDWGDTPWNTFHHIYINGKEVTDLVIPESVTTISKYAFFGCSGLTSITIPESVTSIGENAFVYCSDLTSMIVKEGNTIFDSRDGCNALIETASNKLVTGCKNTTIPNSVISIGDYAFYGCIGLTSITIPESVTSIGDKTFLFCRGLSYFIINNNVTTFGNDVFYGCKELKYFCALKYHKHIPLPDDCSIIVPTSLVDAYEKGYGAKVIAFDRNSSTQTTITIGNNAPEYITLKSVQFGGTAQDVVNGKIVFKGLVPNKDYSITISGEASGIPFSYPITVKTKTITVDAPVLVKATNTTLTVTGGGYNAGDAKVSTGFSSSDYNSRDIKEYKGNEVTITGLAPGERRYIKFMVKTEDGSVFTSDSKTFTTQNITVGGRVTINSASSATLKGTLSGLIDATVKTIGFEENEYKKDEMKLTGLNPNTSYKKQFRVTFEEGGSASCDISFMTDALTLETQQPKVISEGNVIVAATSNLDDEEKNVGFEWRRQDWTDDFDSKTGGAYMYEGQMEGYIRSINANYLWKFRPYYEANNGSRYYGEWKGIDPADFSYFEPTVHTYSKVNVNGNTAQVSGYAQRGTDNITSQGFKYWRSSTKSSQSGQRKTPAIPSDAKTIEATGTVMEANLTDLEYESTYNYVAFIRTSEGETFYGETKTFQTGEDLTSVEEIPANDSTPRIVARYNIQGHRIGTMQRGINIIRMSDGTVRKVMVK